jgi:hypothetical protein
MIIYTYAVCFLILIIVMLSAHMPSVVILNVVLLRVVTQKITSLNCILTLHHTLLLIAFV